MRKENLKLKFVKRDQKKNKRYFRLKRELRRIKRHFSKIYIKKIKRKNIN
jgi:hypothetical protein